MVGFSTRDKLEEARYFLEQFRETVLKPKKSKFYLSAFLHAWRSVIDIMLYDFAEYYGLYNFKSPNAGAHNKFSSVIIFANHILKTARNQKKNQAVEFIEWWFGKLLHEVWKSELSEMRKQVTHIGRLKLPEFVQETSTRSFSLQNYIYAKEFEKEIAVTIEACQKGYSLIESIVNEAEEKFNVKLSARKERI